MNIRPAISAPADDLRIDERSFRRLSDILHRESGIVLSDGKQNLVVSRMSRRLRELGLAGYSDYCAFLEGKGGADERGRLVSMLTTNVTRFFREHHHFDTLDRDILPGLIRHARGGGRVRIWSAGCSTGEEPYGIAMRVLEQMPDAAAHDVRILGTDIDPKVIATGQAGLYSGIDDKHLPAKLRDRYFDTVDGQPGMIRVSDKLRKLVTLAELNLLRDWPMQGRFDVIFCRNVVIYFDAATRATLWTRFADALTRGGQLFLGHSERVNPAAEARFQPVGITQYTRV